MDSTSKIIVQMKEDVGYMRGRVDEILGVLERIPTTYATKDEVNLKIEKVDLKLDKINTKISPLEKIVYGLISVILTAVLVALLGLVIVQNPKIIG